QAVYEQTRVERVVNLYGPSEDTTYSTFVRVETGASSEPSIGRPISNSRAFVLDRRLLPCPVGVAGELHIAGDGLARGYLNRPAMTAEKFIPDPFSDAPGSRMYKTGDLARYLPNGEIEFLGRADHQVKIRGFRIEPGEIEIALGRHQSVRDGVVLVSERGEDKLLVAFVAVKGDAAPTSEELRTFLRYRLPEHMIPSLFGFLDSLPLTPNGKVDRAALRRLDVADARSERVIVAPRDLLEFRMLEIWEDIFQIHPISVTDSFFDLGGHSLLAVRLVAKVKEKLGRDISLASLIRGATVESLARLLPCERDASSESPIVAFRSEGARAPLFLVHPIGGNVLCYAELSRQFDAQRPFYGITAGGFGAAGLNGGEPAPESIEQMSSRYIDAIRRVRPAGPYVIGGWSFGGVVAFEMARQLTDVCGEDVRLVLIDSWAPNPPDEDRPEPDTSEMLIRFLSDLSALSGKRSALDPDQLRGLNEGEQLEIALKHAVALEILPPDMEASHLENLFELFKKNALAF